MEMILFVCKLTCGLYDLFSMKLVREVVEAGGFLGIGLDLSQ